jgi:tetratricopeptide (TPR) repeat protein
MLEDILELHKAGKLDQAEQRYRELLTFNPDDPETLHLLAIVRRQQGDMREAVQLVRRAIELLPDRANYYVTLAGLEFHGHQWELARADFETALRLNPNITAAYGALGQIAMIQGDVARAEENFKLAMKSGQERPDVLIGYGNLLAQRGELDTALKFLSRAVELSPTDPAAQASLGRAYAAKGLHAFAQQALENALKLKPDYHVARRVLIELLIRLDRLNDADEQLRVLMKDPAQRAPALVTMADAFRARGDLQRAATYYRDALQLERDQPRVVGLLAECLAAINLPREAVGAYQSYLEHRPEDRTARHALAVLAAELGLWELSRTTYLALLVSDPEDHAARLGLAAVNEQLGDFAAAERDAALVLSKRPRDTAAALLMARAELRAGTPAAAAARLASLDPSGLNAPQRRQVAMLRGIAHDAAGDVGQALAAFLDAHRALPAENWPDYSRTEGVRDAIATALARGPIEGALTAPHAFLIGAPGAGTEAVAALLGALPGVVVLGDRLNRRGRVDGLTQVEPRYADLSDAELRVFARRYERDIQRLGVPQERVVIDWLKQFDTYLLPPMLRVFPQAKLLIVARAPRTALLNWLAYGTPEAWPIGALDASIERLASALTHQAIARETLGERVLIIDGARAYREREALAAELARHFGTAPAAADALAASAPRSAVGLPLELAPDAERRYGAVLTESFARLDTLPGLL